MSPSGASWRYWCVLATDGRGPVEILSFLNLTRGRVAVLLLFALLGGAAGGLLMRTELASYSTTVDVRVNEIFAPGRPAYDSSSYAPSYIATIGEASVAQQVAKQTKVDESTVASGLSATQSDNGLPVAVVFSAPTESVSKRVAVVAAKVALVRTADLNRERALESQKAARAAFDKAAGAFNEFTVRTGFSDNLPDAISSLAGTDIPNLKAEGDSAGLASAQAQLDKMKAALPEFSPLANEKDAASGQLGDALRNLTSADDAAAVARAPGGLITMNGTVFDSGTSKMVRGVVGGFIVGLFVALALFVIIDSRRTGRAGDDLADDSEGFDPGRSPERRPTPKRGRSRRVGEEPATWQTLMTGAVVDESTPDSTVGAPRQGQSPSDATAHGTTVSDEVLVRLAKSTRPVTKASRNRGLTSRRR